MSEIPQQHLEELARLVNERLGEFGGNTFELSIGVVRVAHDVIKKYYQEKDEAWAMQRLSEIRLTGEMALKLSQQGYERGLAAGKRDRHDPDFERPKDDNAPTESEQQP